GAAGRDVPDGICEALWRGLDDAGRALGVRGFESDRPWANGSCVARCARAGCRGKRNPGWGRGLPYGSGRAARGWGAKRSVRPWTGSPRGAHTRGPCAHRWPRHDHLDPAQDQGACRCAFDIDRRAAVMSALGETQARRRAFDADKLSVTDPIALEMFR